MWQVACSMWHAACGKCGALMDDLQPIPAGRRANEWKRVPEIRETKRK